MARHAYPIIGNCNFESRDDATGKAVHAAVRAVESGLTSDAVLVATLDVLEERLGEYGGTQDAAGLQECADAEAGVEAAYAAAREDIEAARQSRYA